MKNQPEILCMFEISHWNSHSEFFGAFFVQARYQRSVAWLRIRVAICFVDLLFYPRIFFDGAKVQTLYDSLTCTSDDQERKINDTLFQTYQSQNW